MKKLFTLLFALVATTALWAEYFEVDGIYYNILTDKTNEVEVTNNGSFSYSGSIAIPSTVTYNGTTYSVTSIGTYAFLFCSSLTSVTIPNSVTSIGDNAFYECSSLTSVVWNAKNCADFSYSSSPFYDLRSQITSFTFGESVKHIPAYLCYGMSNLTSITIPNSVRSIGDLAFSDCSGLISIVVAEGNPVYDSRENCNAIIRTELNELIAGCQNTIIPNSVTSIGSRAFYDCSSLTSITIPNSVKSIGYRAFCGCSSLTSITIPNSVTSIGDEAFLSCSSLTSVVWNAENCADLSSLPFYHIRSQITSFTFGDNVKCIPADLCDGMNNLTSITIGNSVTSIGEEAFEGCTGLTSITIPNSVTTIEYRAFYGCSGLREISLGSQVKTIGGEAFARCPRIYEVTCLAPEPPVAEESSFTYYDAYFHAPCDAQRYYSVDPVWKKFHNVECIVTENTVMDDITITPSDCEATVVWLSHEQAATYSLVITKQGETYCTLTFNKYGQLTNIALAPARARAKQDAAEYTETSYSFTITGLDAATTYDYTFSVLNNAHETIDMHSGKFTTESTTALDNINSQSPMTNCQKIFRDGQLLIIRHGKTYNAQGVEL